MTRLDLFATVLLAWCTVSFVVAVVVGPWLKGRA